MLSNLTYKNSTPSPTQSQVCLFRKQIIPFRENDKKTDRTYFSKSNEKISTRKSENPTQKTEKYHYFQNIRSKTYDPSLI